MGKFDFIEEKERKLDNMESKHQEQYNAYLNDINEAILAVEFVKPEMREKYLNTIFSYKAKINENGFYSPSLSAMIYISKALRERAGDCDLKKMGKYLHWANDELLDNYRPYFIFDITEAHDAFLEYAPNSAKLYEQLVVDELENQKKINYCVENPGCIKTLDKKIEECKEKAKEYGNDFNKPDMQPEDEVPTR